MYPINFSPVDDSGKLVEPLRRFLALLGIDGNRPLDQLIEQLQSGWDGWGGVLDRPDRFAIFWTCVREMSLYEEVWPEFLNSDYILKIGGPLKEDDRNNAYLCRMIEQGVITGHVFHLGAADRPLDHWDEGVLILGEEHPGGLPVRDGWYYFPRVSYLVESDMMKCLWERSSRPRQLGHTPISFTAVLGRDGQRADAEDLLRHWLNKYAPLRGRVVLVTSNPQASRCYWLARRILESAGFEVTVAASSAALGFQDVKLFVDAVASWLQEYQLYCAASAG